MKFFIDTANIDEIKEGISLGVVKGITTNPKIFSNVDYGNYIEYTKSLASLQSGPICVEVTSNNLEDMLSQARELSAISSNIVVKIPMNYQGMKAVAILSKEGINTNVTACMCTRQAVFAAQAGANYVSLFWARIADLGYDAKTVVSECVEVFRSNKINSEIIIGSFRQLSHISEALTTGVDILTIPPQLLKDMISHPRTDSTIQEFLDSVGK